MKVMIMIRKVWHTIKRFSKRITENHISAYASQSAFFIILSFIPFLILLASLIQFIPNAQRFTSETIINGVPDEVQYLVRGIVNEVYAKSGTIVPITIVVALWSSGKGFQALTNGLNVINGVDETRNYFYMRFRSILYTVIFIVAISVTLVLMVFGRNIQRSLVLYWPFVAKITNFILKLSPIITICILALVFVLFYTYLPNKKQKWKCQMPGAILAATLWTVFSYLFSLYFSLSNNFANMYGSLAAVMMVMIWMHVCMLLFMFGAEVNEILEEKDVVDGPTSKS